MRLLSAAVIATVVGALLAACSANGIVPSSAPAGAGIVLQGMHSPDHQQPLSVAMRAIYVAEINPTSNNIFGFPKNNSDNGPPTCSLSTGNNVNDIDTDQAGNIIVPNGSSGINIYAPPALSGECGTLLGTISDSYGKAGSAASLDAVHGTIVVGNLEGGSSAIVTCTLSSLTCRPMTSPGMYAFGGVAMDRSGNCYADATDTRGLIAVWYYAGCTGRGSERVLTASTWFGGISIDNHGNLVALSIYNYPPYGPSKVAVYSGCSTGTCKLVGGPFTLQGKSVFGHLSRQNEQWVTVDLTTSMVKVYNYTGHGTGLTFGYSFNNGLSCATNLCYSAAFGPSSPK
jgi:hypothetical protein